MKKKLESCALCKPLQKTESQKKKIKILGQIWIKI